MLVSILSSGVGWNLTSSHWFRLKKLPDLLFVGLMVVWWKWPPQAHRKRYYWKAWPWWSRGGLVGQSVNGGGQAQCDTSSSAAYGSGCRNLSPVSSTKSAARASHHDESRLNLWTCKPDPVKFFPLWVLPWSWDLLTATEQWLRQACWCIKHRSDYINSPWVQKTILISLILVLTRKRFISRLFFSEWQKVVQSLTSYSLLRMY